MAANSAVVIPLPEASAVEPLQLRFDPSAAAGMPAHVTLLFPFVDPSKIDEAILERLRLLVSREGRFEVTFDLIDSFAGGTVYLRPLPADPFLRLTADLVAEFGIKPYEGRHATVTPHLTVGQLLSDRDAAQVRSELSPALPISTRVEAAWLVTYRPETGWIRSETLPLG